MVAPPQGIDRDALNRVLEEFSLLGLDEKSADRILALVRPVEGVVLTSEEADLACTALRKVPWREQSNLDRAWALAARLEGC